MLSADGRDRQWLVVGDWLLAVGTWSLALAVRQLRRRDDWVAGDCISTLAGADNRRVIVTAQFGAAHYQAAAWFDYGCATLQCCALRAPQEVHGHV